MLNWEDVTRLATQLNGVPVLGCRPDSPAARAGVRYGDIVMAVNDMPTPDWASYIEARTRGRGRMRVEVFRAGETLVFEFALPAATAPVDPVALLEGLIEDRVVPLPSGPGRREREPS